MLNKLEEEIVASLVDGYLRCDTAWKVAEKLRVPRRKVGDAVDELGVRVVDCQLGCFIVRKSPHDDLAGKEIGQTVAERVQALVENGHLACAAAFKVVRKLGITPKDVGDAATKLNIKIRNCQLGCF